MIGLRLLMAHRVDIDQYGRLQLYKLTRVRQNDLIRASQYPPNCKSQRRWFDSAMPGPASRMEMFGSKL